MTNSRFTCPTLLCGLVVVVSLATCGCTSMKGTSDKWATAWKKSTEPKPVDPNHEEIVTYWGQKKKQTTLEEMPAELKERLTKKTDPSQRSRDYADNFKAGNLRLKEGRLDEARRAYELALAAKPDDPDVHHRLAVVADKQQMFGAADDHYEAALRRRPRDPNLLSDIGYSHILRGDEKRAEKTLRETLAIDPSHQGAMLNLGTLYGKQGRYDDALALLRQGTTEGETRKYMAQLFPQGPPSGVAQASNQAEAEQRSAPPIQADERTDVRNMTFEQLKSEMARRQLEGVQNRQPQFAQIPSQRDLSGDSLMQDPRAVQDQRPSITPNNPVWMMTNPPQPTNPSFGQSSPYSPPTQAGTSIQPGTTTIPLPSNLQLGSQMLPYPGTIPNGPAQQPGFAAAPPQGSLVAPPGTSPHSNMDFWQGAPVQPNGGVSRSPSAQYPIEQMGYTQGSATSGVSASHAAAQLGMSAGPGSLFPIVASDSASAGGMSMHPSVTPNYEQRFGGEFPQPPQYQNPVNQYAPTSVPNSGTIQLLGGDGSASNPSAPNWPGASSSRSNGTAQQGSTGNDVTIAPSSPTSSMPRPWDAAPSGQQFGSNGGSSVVQAGGSSGWGQSATHSGDPLDTFQSEMSSGANSRYAKTPWGDSPGRPGGSRPYNGAWPNSNSLSNAASSGSGNSPNSLPMWNGGNGAGVSNQSGGGPATGSSSNGSLQQWPYSPQR